MSTVVLSLYTHMALRSMLENLVIHFFRVVLSVFPQIDQLVLSTWVLREESCSSWDQCNSSTMISSRRRTTKKFKMPFSDGFLTMRVILNRALRTNRSWVNIIMYLISLLWQTDFDHACKSRTNCPRILQLCLMRSYTSLIQIWSRRH